MKRLVLSSKKILITCTMGMLVSVGLVMWGASSLEWPSSFSSKNVCYYSPSSKQWGTSCKGGGGKPPIIYRLFFVQWWCSNSGQLIREEKPATRLTLASFSAWQGQTLGTHTDEQTVGSHCLTTRRRTYSYKKVVRQREAAKVSQWYSHWMVGQRFSFKNVIPLKLKR